MGLNREDQTGPHRVAVEQHRARPAGTVLAAQMGAGQPALLAQEVGQRHPRLYHGFDRAAVDRHVDRQLMH